MANPVFGPSGNSESFYQEGYKSSNDAPLWCANRGLFAYEYQAGSGLRASDATLSLIGENAKKCNVKMSLHTPYFISLSSTTEETRLKSISYIEQSINAASLLGARKIVIHAGSCAKITRAEALELSKRTLFATLEKLDTKGVLLGIETMGKLNQLGTLSEVLELCKLDKEKIVPVVDFGHLNARSIGTRFPTSDKVSTKSAYKSVFDRIATELSDNIANDLHCHFSKIEFTKAGEKKHLTFSDDVYGPNYEPLCEVIHENDLSPTIICESAGTMAEDALTMQNYFKNLYLNKL